MFEINGMSRTPVYEQLVEQVERYVLGGILAVGDKLPSVRNLSVTLSINPNTIQKAYSDLMGRGIICGVPGKGNFVTEEALGIVRAKGRDKLASLAALVRELKNSGVTQAELEELIGNEYETEGGKEK